MDRNGPPDHRSVFGSLATHHFPLAVPYVFGSRGHFFVGLFWFWMFRRLPYAVHRLNFPGKFARPTPASHFRVVPDSLWQTLKRSDGNRVMLSELMWETGKILFVCIACCIRTQ